MRKTIFTVIVLLAMTLTACSAATTTPQADPNKLNTSYTNALPVATQLLIGTFKLDGTKNVVTAKQAKALIPLWQVYESLSTSDTAAQEEINALLDQIQETLTPTQMQAIKGMQLTSQDMFTTLQEQGISGSNRQSFNQSNSGNTNGNSNGSAPAPGGEGPGLFFRNGGNDGGGNRGGGFGGGFGGGQGLNPQQIATAQARRSQNGGGNFRFENVPAPLIQALVKYLQQKAGP